jgi:hypothetical protein
MVFICLTTWDYAIPHFGDKEHLAMISKCVFLSPKIIPVVDEIRWYPVCCTLCLAFIPHNFQAHLLTTLLATLTANL